MRIRLKDSYPGPSFRRVGVTFTKGVWQDTANMTLTPAQVAYLQAPESRAVFEYQDDDSYQRQLAGEMRRGESRFMREEDGRIIFPDPPPPSSPSPGTSADGSRDVATVRKSERDLEGLLEGVLVGEAEEDPTKPEDAGKPKTNRGLRGNKR